MSRRRKQRLEEKSELTKQQQQQKKLKTQLWLGTLQSFFFFTARVTWGLTLFYGGLLQPTRFVSEIRRRWHGSSMGCDHR